ncbi:mechanosensitive ion channel family protein, partial [Paenibacillus chitinolyticus]
MKKEGFFETIYTQVYGYVTDADMWVNIGMVLLKIAAIILISRIVLSVVQAAVNRIFQHRKGSKIQMDQRRVDTMRVLVNNIVRYTLYFLAI